MERSIRRVKGPNGLAEHDDDQTAQRHGVLTTTNLWPWPMNQRIKDATDFAGTAYDVEAELEAIFGAIPAGCGGAG